MENIPRHVAIIPDGNRRWAKKRGLPPWIGHKIGARTFEKIAKKASALDIFSLTFWAGSHDNLTKRPPNETKFLKEIYRKHFSRLLKNRDIFDKKIKVSVFGLWEELLSERTKEPIFEIMEKTKLCDKRFLNFLIGYNGNREMIEAVKKIIERSKNEPNLKITPALIKENLWTRDLPPVDLVIRTGTVGDPHWSNGFMMWDTADSQFHFSETLWPDFDESEFQEAVESYKGRERRLGA